MMPIFPGICIIAQRVLKIKMIDPTAGKRKPSSSFQIIKPNKIIVQYDRYISSILLLRRNIQMERLEITLKKMIVVMSCLSVGFKAII